MELNLYEQTAEKLRLLHKLDPRSIDKSFQYDNVHDSQTAFAAAKKMSRWARCQEKEYKVCAKHWIIAFGEDSTILYSAIVI